MQLQEHAWKRYTAPAVARPHSAHPEILNRIPAGARVLDVGCSEGYIAQMLGERARVWGVDGNAAAVAAAKVWCVDAWVSNFNDLAAAPEITQRFDVILFADVLEHVLDSAAVLRYYAAHVEEGGRILVSLPNIAHWRTRLNLARGRFDYAEYGVLDSTHLRFFTFKTGRALVEGAGLRVTEMNGVGYSSRLAKVDQLAQRGAAWLSQQMLITAVPARSEPGHTPVELAIF